MQSILCNLHIIPQVNMKKYLSVSVVAVLCSLVSCKDEYTICTLSKDVKFIAGFYQSQNTPAPAPQLSVSILNTNAFIYTNQGNVAEMGFGLNSTLDSNRYVITIAGNLPKDTVTIRYSSQTSNLSLECGSITTNTINSISSTHHTIDSIKITNATCNNTPIQNARIFY